MLQTKRLILKLPEMIDLDHLAALRADPEIMADTNTGVQSREQVKKWIVDSDVYYKKHGLAFFSVFEKETGEFVGQAGLFHLGLNDTQPEIELVYRLHTQFWNKGYATELAKALIRWGFEKHHFPKIIAVFYPENERSRRVMEKVGMSYCGMVEFEGKPLPRYEIVHHQFQVKELKLLPASKEVDYPIIQNMASYYAYDLSEYMGWPQESDGTASIGMDYIQYWQEPDTYPFIIKYKDELVGFVIIDKKVSNPANDFNIAQFFILKKFQGKGIGRYIACQCLDKFSGNWEVFVMPGNEGAYRFWRKIIKVYTRYQFKEFTRSVNGYSRNVFEFSSRFKITQE